MELFKIDLRRISRIYLSPPWEHIEAAGQGPVWKGQVSFLLHDSGLFDLPIRRIWDGERVMIQAATGVIAASWAQNSTSAPVATFPICALDSALDPNVDRAYLVRKLRNWHLESVGEHHWASSSIRMIQLIWKLHGQHCAQAKNDKNGRAQGWRITWLDSFPGLWILTHICISQYHTRQWFYPFWSIRFGLQNDCLFCHEENDT